MAKHYKCDICSKKFTDKQYLTSHKHIHTIGTPFKCPQCPYQGKTKKYLARHTKQVHKELSGEHKCNVCGKLFLHPSSLKVHAMVHSGEKPHKCKFCDKTFRVTYTLNIHMLVHTNEKPFACSFCDYACRDSSTLRKHQNKHMGLEKIYQCKICNKGYKSRAALKIHIAETHLELDMKKFKCTHCDKMFKTNAHRKTHIEVVHKRSLVCNCPLCGRRIVNKNNLGAHMRTHLDERPFSCTHDGCNVRFKDKNSLTKHKIIHNPSLHFPCSYCGRKFARKSHKKDHERVMHVERIKNVECDYCGSKFYTKNYLIKHIQTKHVYKQVFKYICDTCGLVTHNKPSIVMHIKYGHNNDYDVQCKICDNKIVYKKHMYLKQHYWKTHNIRYKITKKGYNKSRKEKNSVEVKVEPIEADSYEEIQLLDIEKHENEDIEDCLDYSKSVLSEDIAASVLRADNNGTEIDFDEFFVRHVFAKQEKDTEDTNTDGVNTEQNEYVKNHIKKILKKTEKIEKEKALQKKLEEEEKDRVKREKEKAVEQAKRERMELEELRRVRVMYNERMAAALKKEKDKKEQVKIKYFKKITESSKSTKNTDEISESLKDGKDIENSDLNNSKDTDLIESNAIDKTQENLSKENKFQNSNFNQNNISENDFEINNDEGEDLITKCVQKCDLDNKCIDDNDIILENIRKSIKNNQTDDEININEKYNANELNDNTSKNNETECHQENINCIVIQEIEENDKTDMNKDNENELNNTSNQKEYLKNNQESTNDVDNKIDNENNTNKQKLQENINTEEFINDISTQIDINNDKINKNERNVKINSEIKENNDSNKDSLNNNNTDEQTTSDDDQPLLERRKRFKRKITKRKVENVDINNKKSKKINFKTYQCYVCFKLYQTKEELTTHCQEHFDICHTRMLSKCPLCDHVSHKGLAKHMRIEHDTELTTLHNTFRDNKGDGSGYNYNINGTIIQVIPSVNALNKTASNNIDKVRRDLKDKVISKSKLVKRGNEWIVEKEKIAIEFDVIPELNDRELSKLKVTDTDVDRLGQLSSIVKKKGLKMMFPCFHCDKICQNFSGLKLHQRRHEANPKPFKPRVKRSEKVVKDTKKIKLDKGNRQALPKPILNKHKCDEKLKKFFESNIRGGDIEFWQFLKIYNKMNKEKVNDFKDLEKRTDFGNHLDYYKDKSDNDVQDSSDE